MGPPIRPLRGLSQRLSAAVPGNIAESRQRTAMLRSRKDRARRAGNPDSPTLAKPRPQRRDRSVRIGGVVLSIAGKEARTASERPRAGSDAALRADPKTSWSARRQILRR